MNIAWMTILGLWVAHAPASETPNVQASAQRAYRTLKPDEVTHKRLGHKPVSKHGFTEVDVTERIRSASFGHATTLLVPGGPNPKTFYVHHGRSTNTPEAYFGPFPLDAPRPAADGPASRTGVLCGTKVCSAGQVCCNASCGICAGPSEACLQEVCGPPDAAVR